MTRLQTRQHALLPDSVTGFVATSTQTQRHYLMPTHVKKITLTVLTIAGLLFTAPLTFAHDSRRERGRAHSETAEEYQRGQETLAAGAGGSNRYYHSRGARRYHAQRRLRRECQSLNQYPSTQHEDGLEGNSYWNGLMEDRSEQEPGKATE